MPIPKVNMAEVEFSLGKCKILAAVVKKEKINLAAFKKREGEKRATSKLTRFILSCH